MHKKQCPVSQMVSTAFHPLPTIKTVQKNNEKKIVYDAAHHMFRNYPLHKPILIYKHHINRLCYDFYIERTESGWKDMVYTHPIPSTDDKIIYIVDGLLYAIKEEKEIQPLLVHMIQQMNMMCRLLNL